MLDQAALQLPAQLPVPLPVLGVSAVHASAAPEHLQLNGAAVTAGAAVAAAALQCAGAVTAAQLRCRRFARCSCVRRSAIAVSRCNSNSQQRKHT